MKKLSKQMLIMFLLCGCSGEGGTPENPLDMGGSEDVPVVDNHPSDIHQDIAVPDTMDVWTGDSFTPDVSWETPCVSSSDCVSGFCVDTREGKRCSRSCFTGQECGSFLTCAQVGGGGADQNWICIDPTPTFCAPCSTNADCQQLVSSYKMQCVGLPVDAVDRAEGETVRVSVCLPLKPDQAECPAFTTPQDIEGQTFCQHKNGQCTCPASDLPQTGSCSLKNDNGICGGSSSCTDGQWECTAEPATEEICDDQDNNCSGQTDEGCDDDNDQYCDSTMTVVGPPWPAVCPSGNGDCQDDNPYISPQAPEVCGNHEDDNCDGVVDERGPMDEDGALGCTSFFEDKDHDEWGIAAKSRCLCGPILDPDNEVYDTATVSGDCNDDEGTIHPMATEYCNGKDDNCDGETDPMGSLNCVNYYLDDDEDTYGSNLVVPRCLCAQDTENKYTALVAGDCDKDDPDVHPGAPEVCNGQDDNCNGIIDEGVLLAYYLDNDGDGYGAGSAVMACTPPTQHVLVYGDCNDYNLQIHPQATETCNEVDDDCNGVVDDAPPLILVDVYRDFDGDGYGGQNAVPTKHCLADGKAPDGYALANDDCDDSNSTVWPGAPELCDGILNNCTKTLDDMRPVMDAQCPEKCPGNWPLTIGTSRGWPTVGLLGDTKEFGVIVNGGGLIKALNATGENLWEVPCGINAYSIPILADMFPDTGPEKFMEVVLFEEGKMRVLSGKNGAELETHSLPDVTGYFAGVIFDIDNDGIQDIVSEANVSLTIILRNGNGSEKSRLTISPPVGSVFRWNTPSIADLDGDGVAEVIVGTGYSDCGSAGLAPCMGYLLVYDGVTGVRKFADQFAVTNPSTGWAAQGLGMWPILADLDTDGDLEVFQYFGGTGNGAHLWDLDGHPAALTNPMGMKPSMAPIQANGQLTANGALRDIGGAAVDIDNDGIYEVVSATTTGLSISKGVGTDTNPKVMDGYPVKVGGHSSNAPYVGDINRDGRLEIFYVGALNSSLNCYRLGEGTYADNRVLTSGQIDALGRNIHRTGSYDPFEPNDLATFVPASATNPVTQSRAFSIQGFLDTFDSSAIGWIRRVIATLGHQGDRDFYWIEGPSINVNLTPLTSVDVDYDLNLHIYTNEAGTWQFNNTLSSSNLGKVSDVINCYPASICPDVTHAAENKLFIIEVHGKTPATDYGPWPYLLKVTFTKEWIF